jgi:hypothetical protein
MRLSREPLEREFDTVTARASFLYHCRAFVVERPAETDVENDVQSICGENGGVVAIRLGSPKLLCMEQL